MKKITYLFLLTLVVSACSSMKNKSGNVKKEVLADVTMFPKAEKDMVRHIIELPRVKNQENFKVEFFVVKKMKVDCNYHTLQGSFIQKNLKGWGYDYYEFKTEGQVSSTMMACLDGQLTEKEIPSETEFINYNSKLPIVVYTPKGYEVRRKIWSVNEDL